MDFAEGTRLVRVVPDVPAGLPAPVPTPTPRRSINVVRAAVLDDEDDVDDLAGDRADDVDTRTAQEIDDEVRNVVPTDGSPVDVLLSGDGGPEHDTVVFERMEGENEDPRAAIPAWEDIVFGVRRHR